MATGTKAAVRRQSEQNSSDRGPRLAVAALGQTCNPCLIMDQRALGVDAAGKAGWIGVIIDGSGFSGARVATLVELIDWAEPVAAIGVDIPIGNLPGGRRASDAAARAFIGPRRASVFNSPPIEGISHDSYEAANQHLEALGQAKMSHQTWALRAKVIETDAVARSDQRLIEVHPEVCFRAIGGRDLQWPKKTWNGQLLRRSLLSSAGIDLPDDLGRAGAVPVDDVLDAAAAAWSARRYALGQAVPLPSPPEVDPDGRQLAIWY